MGPILPDPHRAIAAAPEVEVLLRLRGYLQQDRVAVEQILEADRSHVTQLALVAVSELEPVLERLRLHDRELLDSAPPEVRSDRLLAADFLERHGSSFAFGWHVRALVKTLRERPWSVARPGDNSNQDAVTVSVGFYDEGIPRSVAIHCEAALASLWALWEMMQLLMDGTEDDVRHVMNEVVSIRKLPQSEGTQIPHQMGALMAWRRAGIARDIGPYARVALALFMEWKRHLGKLLESNRETGTASETPQAPGLQTTPTDTVDVPDRHDSDSAVEQPAKDCTAARPGDTPDETGLVSDPSDRAAYRPASKLLADYLAVAPTMKALDSILMKHPEIRRYKPSKQRRSIHLGDWQKYVDQLKEHTLDSDGFVRDPVEIEERKALIGAQRRKRK